MARKTEQEGKVATSITLFRHQKDWINENPTINFSSWVRTELENLIIRTKLLMKREV